MFYGGSDLLFRTDTHSKLVDSGEISHGWVEAGVVDLDAYSGGSTLDIYKIINLEYSYGNVPSDEYYLGVINRCL